MNGLTRSHLKNVLENNTETLKLYMTNYFGVYQFEINSCVALFLKITFTGEVGVVNRNNDVC